MDSFTRNYSIFLAVVTLAILAWVFYEPAEVSELNDLLSQDSEISAYPYRFKVTSLENGIATISSPRSVEYPVFKALGLIYPELANRKQDDPKLMNAQDQLATVQKKVASTVTNAPTVKAIRWELDKDWLSDHGVQIGLGL